MESGGTDGGQGNASPESCERASHLRGNSTGPNYYDSTPTETERRGIGKNVYSHGSMASLRSGGPARTASCINQPRALDMSAITMMIVVAPA